MNEYSVVRQLHKGDLSSVYQVTRKEANGEFIIKKVSELLRPSLSVLEDEANALCKLNHPNIIRYIDYFTEEKHLFLVMEYAGAGDLKQRLENIESERNPQPLSESEILNVFVPLLQALSYLHQQGHIHGSISPQSIFFTEDGTVKLGDFGFSRVHQTKMETVTRSNKYYDSILYMSPEFFKFGRRTTKNDIWAAGCILYELMMLKHPFDGSLFRDLKDTANKPEFPPIPEALYTKDLRALVTSMLMFDESGRISASEALEQSFIKSFLFSLRDD